MSARPVENDLRHAACPLCGAGDLRDLGLLVGPREVQFSTLTIALRRAPHLGECAACGSRFVQDAVPASLAATLYTDGRGGDRWTAQGTWDRHHAPAVVERIASLATSGRRVLDVGCNTGDLLDFVRARGAVTSGVEYSADSRRRCVAKGHAVFASMHDVTGTYEVITAFDLVEHLYDVPDFMARCASALAPGGRMVILTGDIECEGSRRDGAAWWYVQFPEHVVFPSRRYWSSVPGFALESATNVYNGGPDPTGPRAALSALWRRVRGVPPPAPRALDHVMVVLTRAE